MSVHVESVGQGRPLVLLHAGAMHSGLWMTLLPRLVDRYRLHMVDLPGHGYSPPVEPYTLAALTEAIADRFATLSDSREVPPMLLGWSLGAAVALEWAIGRPDWARALVLTGASPCFMQRDDWPHAMAKVTLEQFGDELAVSYRLTFQRFIRLQLRASEYADAAENALRTQLFKRGPPSPDILRKVVHLLAATDLRSSVARIRQPTLVIAGDRDTLTPLAAAQWLASALPRSALTVIPGAAHAPFLSHPDAFVAALGRFDEH
jgi:pimeloyl-[acyl-carrier protein] methyl ester esterase